MLVKYRRILFLTLILSFVFISVYQISVFGEKEQIAVLEFSSKGGISKDQASIITDRFRAYLVKTGGVKVMERSKMDMILKEQGFQQTALCNDTQCSVEIGQLLAVNRILTGSVSKFGSMYTITVRMIDVEKGEILKEEFADCKCPLEDILTKTTKDVAYKILGKTSGGYTTPTSKPQNQAGDIDMIHIPAGEFTMGSNAYDDEKPIHKVYLDAYYISKYEITQAQYKKFMNATGHRQPNCDWSPSGKAKHPVVCVDWNDAVAFCKWAGGRLPTEAEWEKAARGTDGRKYPWGNDWNCNKSCNSVSPCKNNDTCEVGSYSSDSSPYGVMDMGGNVWEWCNDWYGENYYSSSPYKNPQGPSSGSYRVSRGGSWDNSSARVLRSANRFRCFPSDRYVILGFRLVR